MTQSNTTTRALHATPILLACIAVFLGAVDLTIATAVLPRMLVDLNISIDTDLGRASWIITGYLLAYTISMAFAGRLSDLYGRRAAYIAGLGLFLLGSLVVALAPTLELVVAGRVIQALGAGGLVPVTMALTADVLPPAARVGALGIVAAIDTAGWMVGHLYGGVLMRAFDNWRLLFWLNIPFGIVALALTLRAIAGIGTPRRPGKFDWLGALTLSGALSALNIGLAAGADLGTADFYGEHSGPPVYAIPLVLLAVALLVAWWRVERRSADPLVEVSLFSEHGVAGASISNLLLGFALAVALANVPLFVNARIALSNLGDQNALRRGAWDSGWLLSALTLTMAVLAVPGGRLAARFGNQAPILAGMLLGALGFLAASRWQADTGYPEMALALALAGVGLGLALAPLAAGIIDAVGDDRRGSAAAIVIVLRLVGMTLGISALTAWGVQRQNLLRRLGAADPVAITDPARFLLRIATQVVGETFLFAVGACVLSLVVIVLLATRRQQTALS